MDGGNFQLKDLHLRINVVACIQGDGTETRRLVCKIVFRKVTVIKEGKGREAGQVAKKKNAGRGALRRDWLARKFRNHARNNMDILQMPCCRIR